MALLTHVSFEEAASLLQAYGMTLEELVPLAAGSVNSNFLLKASGRELFARVYEEQGPRGAEFELRLNEVLASSGVPVARPIRTLDGRYFAIAPSSGKPFSLYERVSGEVLCQKLVTADVCRSVGEALARVHSAQLGDLAVPPSRFDGAGLRARLERVGASGRPDLAGGAEEVARLLESALSGRNPALPAGLIHGDLFRDNVLVQGQKISALLDFESACQGPYVYDLIVTMLAFCYGGELSVPLARAMILGYHRVRPLSRDEILAFESETAVACARFATTRLTDFSLRVAPGEKPGRDFRRFLERHRAIQSGLLEPVQKELLQGGLA